MSAEPQNATCQHLGSLEGGSSTAMHGDDAMSSMRGSQQKETQEPTTDHDIRSEGAGGNIRTREADAEETGGLAARALAIALTGANRLGLGNISANSIHPKIRVLESCSWEIREYIELLVYTSRRCTLRNRPSPFA